MLITDEDRDHVSFLLESGDKLGAVRYIQQAFSLDAEQALSLAEKLEEQLFERLPDWRSELSPPMVVGTLLTVLGFLLLSLSFIFGFRDYRFASQSHPATGKVINYDEWKPTSGTDLTTYSPVITYTYGTRVFERHLPERSSTPVYVIGQQIPLLIDPLNPGEPVTNSFLERWFLVMLMAGFGLLFSLIGFVTRKVVRVGS